jgi:hypothetical protein
MFSVSLSCVPEPGSWFGQLFPAMPPPAGSSGMEIRLPGVPSWPGRAPETERMTFAWWLVPCPAVLGMRLRRGLKTG